MEAVVPLREQLDPDGGRMVIPVGSRDRQDLLVVIRQGDMVGVVSKQRILHTLRSEGNGYVQSVMNRIFDVAQKSESLSSAFRKLSSRNLSIIPVVENQQLVGIVTLQNLMHSMALLAETRKLRKAALES